MANPESKLDPLSPRRHLRRELTRIALPVVAAGIALSLVTFRLLPSEKSESATIQIPGLGADAPLPATFDALLTIVADGANHPELRLRAAEELLKQDTDEARQSLIRPIRFSSRALAARLAAALASTPGGAQTLLDSIERRLLSPRLLLAEAVKQNVLRANLTDGEARIASLVKSTKSTDPLLDRTIDSRRQALAPQTAKLNTGRAVFLGNCSVCHNADGQGATVGPNLDSIGFRGLDRIVEDVFDPSRYVDPVYRSTRIDLKDETAVSGLVKARTDRTITLVNFAGHDTTVNVADIESIRPTELSPMPSGFDQAITPEDFNHLMAYLLTRRQVEQKLAAR